MSMEPNTPTPNALAKGMGVKNAIRLEFFIIGLGILALILIFQPFSVRTFAFGGILVVIAGLVNNLLPLARTDVPLRSVGVVAMVVAMIFCIVVLLAIVAAWAYGVLFLPPPNPDTTAGKAMINATPFYLHSFTWSVAVIAAVLAGLISLMNRNKP
jgi:cytochrome c biogenesis factor